MRTLQIKEALREALRQEMESDARVFVFGEDVGVYGGLDGVTEGLQERFGQGVQRGSRGLRKGTWRIQGPR